MEVNAEGVTRRNTWKGNSEKNKQKYNDAHTGECMMGRHRKKD